MQSCLTVLRKWDYPQGLAPFWRFYIFEEGKAEITWHDNSNRERIVETDPQKCYLIPPDTPFSGRLLTGQALHFFIHFSLGDPSDQIGQRIYTLAKREGTAFFIQKLKKDSSNLADRGDTAAELFYVTALSLKEIPGDHWPLPIPDKRIRLSILHMKENFADSLTVSDLADLSSLSVNGFSRLFSETTGIPPVKYLNRIRLSRAADLLSHGNLSMEEISEACGFSNRYYFTKKFSAHFDISPALFRKMNRS